MPVLARSSTQPVARHREIGDGGDAALQQLRQRDLRRGAGILGIEAEHREVFVERALPQLVAAILLGQALVGGLGERMAVDVDQARDRHEPPAVDRGVDRAGEARPDMGDLVALEHQVGVVEIDVALFRIVPGDDMVEVRDASGFAAHRSFTLLRPDWHDPAMTAKLTEAAKGVYIIAATPFTDDGALDLQSVDTLTDFYLRLRCPWLHPARHDGRGAQADRRGIDRRGEASDQPRRRPAGDRGRESRRPRERPPSVARSHDRRRRPA